MCNDHGISLTRRRFVRAGASLGGTLILAGCGSSNPQTPSSPQPNPGSVQIQAGCYSATYGGSQAALLGCGPISTFGDPAFDQRFAQEMVLQRQFWGPGVQVQPFNECSADRANALSLPQRLILFGYHLTVKVIRNTGSDLIVAGVLAHEYAHQVQFAYNWMDPTASTVRNTELEADAFAGIYMAIAKNWTGSELDRFVTGMYQLGDTNFTDPSHHGTPQERAAAAVLGMQVGYQIMQSGQSVSYRDLHAFFVQRLYQNIDGPQLSFQNENFFGKIDSGLEQGIRAGMRKVTELETPIFPMSYRRQFFPGKLTGNFGEKLAAL